MERSEIIAQLTNIASEIFQIENLVLTEDMSAANVDTWNSLTYMQFLTAIEVHFGFKFKMMELIKLKNIGDIINSINSHIV